MEKDEKVICYGKTAWKISSYLSLGSTVLSISGKCLSKMWCKDRERSLYGISSSDRWRISRVY